MRPDVFLSDVCRRYNIGRLLKWSSIPLGLINIKYHLYTTHGQYVVRISARARRQLMFEVALLRRVRVLQVPQLVPYAKNRYISATGHKPFIVYKYIDGYPPRRITDSLIRQIGFFQGKFHQLGSGFHLAIPREPFTYDFPLTKIKKFDSLLSGGLPKEFLPAYRTVRNTLKSVRLPAKLPVGPIHVDIKPENILVKAGRLVGVLDFDNGYRGPYLVDVGKTLTWFCVRRGRFNHQRAQLLFKAYEQVRQFHPIERDHLGDALRHAVASHIFLDYYKYMKKIIPLSYLRMLHREFLPILTHDKIEF